MATINTNMPTISSAIFNGAGLTMSSREIAELCEARHNDVVATIVRLFDQGVLRESRKTTRTVAPEGGGRPTQVYDLTKRDTLVVVSGYSAELRAKIIDRWQELEGAMQSHMLALPRDFASALRALADSTDKVQALEAQNAELAPKAEALDLISASNGSLTITQASKLLSVKVAELTRWMNANRWIYRQNGSWLAYMDQIQNGRLEYKEANYTDRNTGMACCKPYCHITPKGLAKLAHELGVSAPGGEMH
ncbi:DNA-binding protein [Granulibacter bethesdensis]|uniref:DNA-binding protein n=1 Tax=Granulibacter bethesdensis TaxID=364410 RepID=A0AAN0RE24_9PROT|nr:phage regulatory protein/antirepressor Ant [Granulibacter bethesdensis]AHJ63258.1 DNA-binding protein [Granulibacter bethesdensis]